MQFYPFLVSMILTANSVALAQNNPINPSDYFKSKLETSEPADFKSVNQSQIYIKGVRQKVFSSQFGTIYVPDLGSFNEADLDRSLCAPELRDSETCKSDDEACKEKHLTEATVIRAEKKLSQDAAAYADLILLTIKKKCGANGPQETVGVNTKPEIGVSFKDESQRDGKRYKIFNNLDKKLGVGMEF